MFELKIMCPEAHIDELSEALDALDALSVSVEDADAATDAEQALFGEPDMPPPKGGWQRSRVTALFNTEDTGARSSTTAGSTRLLWRLLAFGRCCTCGSRLGAFDAIAVCAS